MRVAQRGRSGSGAFLVAVGVLVGALGASILAPRASKTVMTGAAGPAPGARTATAGAAPLAGSSGDAGAAGPTPADSSPAATPSAGATRAAGAPAGGRAVAQAGTAGSGDASTGAAGAVDNGGSTARGVTGDTIKVGIAWADLRAFQYLGKKYDLGDNVQQWQAIAAAWKRDGVTPINGRNIELVFQAYNPIQADDQRAACTSLVNDQKVFMVIGLHDFFTGAACVAREYKTPLITNQGFSEADFAANAPWLFQPAASTSAMFRNLSAWANAHGLLKGHTIGIYHSDDAALQADIDKNLKPGFAKLGYPIKVEATTDAGSPNQEFASHNEALAIQKFIANGVDLIIPQVGATAKLSLVQQAEQAQYHPKYIEDDVTYGTFDSSTDDFPPDQYEGVYGMTTFRFGEAAAGMGIPPEAEKCYRDYEQFSGKQVDHGTSGQGHLASESGIIQANCVEATMLIEGLKAAGPNLTQASFAQGLETVQNLSNGWFPNLTWSPQNHSGAHEQRTVQWHSDCMCYRAIGSFEPLSVP